MNELRERLMRISERDDALETTCPHCGDSFISDMFMTPRMVDEIIAILRDLDYVQLPPDSAILEGVSNLKYIGSED